MIDAVLYAVRDGIRAAGFNYGCAECEITDDGKPPPRAGNWFVAVHDGVSRSTADNQLYEYYDFSVTVSARTASVALDRIGDQLIARNIVRIPPFKGGAGANIQGFNAKVEQLRAFLHMNWNILVLSGSNWAGANTPNSANENIAAWATGTVYGICEPARYRGAGRIQTVYGDWFKDDPDQETVGLKQELRFADAKRFQPQTLAVGPFV